MFIILYLVFYIIYYTIYIYNIGVWYESYYRKKEVNASINSPSLSCEKRNTIPILANVLIEAKDNFLSLAATDMEIAELQKVS